MKYLEKSFGQIPTDVVYICKRIIILHYFWTSSPQYYDPISYSFWLKILHSSDSVQLVKQILVDEITKQVNLGSSGASKDQWNDQGEILGIPEDQNACIDNNTNADIKENRLEQKSAKPNDINTQWARISKKIINSILWEGMTISRQILLAVYLLWCP